MRTRYLALGAAALLAAAALTGCSRILPVGPMSSESPEIDAVTAVVLDTSGDLTISEGEPSLTIHAPERVLDVLTTRVVDGVLELGRKPGPFPFAGAEIRYELTLPSLDSIEVNGAGDVASSVSGADLRIEITGVGDVSVDGVDADTVEVGIAGSGDVALSGTADSLEIELDGTGEVDADALEVEDAVVAISGTGDAELHVTGTLDARVSGIGSVHYRGNPEVRSEVSGLGEVAPAD